MQVNLYRGSNGLKFDFIRSIMVKFTFEAILHPYIFDKYWRI